MEASSALLAPPPRVRHCPHACCEQNTERDRKDSTNHNRHLIVVSKRTIYKSNTGARVILNYLISRPSSYCIRGTRVLSQCSTIVLLSYCFRSFSQTSYTKVHTTRTFLVENKYYSKPTLQNITRNSLITTILRNCFFF